LSELVTGIHRTEIGLIVRTRRGQEDQFDRVLATPSIPSFLEMTPSLPEEYKRSISQIPYQANITLALGLKQSISPYYWLNVTDPQSPFVAVIEHTRLFRDPDYGDTIPLYLSRYLSADHPLY